MSTTSPSLAADALPGPTALVALAGGATLLARWRAAGGTTAGAWLALLAGTVVLTAGLALHVLLRRAHRTTDPLA